MKIRLGHIVFWTTVIAADFLIYFVIAMALMSYEDHYEPTNGELYSWKSMTTFDRIAFAAFYLWIIINIVFIARLLWEGYRIIKAKYF